MTAEEFIRKKIKKRDNIEGGMFGLWYYKCTGDEALRWAHEFAELKVSEVKNNTESERVCLCKSKYCMNKITNTNANGYCDGHQDEAN
jgi:hypothetical protein